MSSRTLILALAALGLHALHAGAAHAQATGAATSGGSLTAFRSESDLARYLTALRDARQRVIERQQRAYAQQRAEAACAAAPGGVRVSRPGAGLLRRRRSDPTREAVIVGRVRSGSGDAAVAGAQLSIASPAASATSGSDGRFALRVPAAQLASRRDVSFTARQIGYAPREKTISLGAGDSVVVDVKLCAVQLRLEQVVVTGVATAQVAPASKAAAADAMSFKTEADESITNVQHAGVDEGGIVKQHGDHLVVLRRGRLFTVAVDNGALRPVDQADAFGPGIDPRGAWYDELLMYGDRIVVIGYSYARGGTEIGVFGIDREGTLRHEGTYHLRSNDYYSSRNYASRLVGSRLVLYTPLFLHLAPGVDPIQSLPALRHWRGSADTGSFRRIAPARRVFRAAQLPDSTGGTTALHSVTTCDLAAPELACESTVVVGPWGHVFYVSPSAVYVWTTEWRRAPRECDAECPPNSATVYRLPLDGSAPSALGAMGSPVDQFSFLESSDGRLNVLVRANGSGDWMWSAERSRGVAALLRVPISEFGDGSRAAARWRYRPLPAGEGYVFHNRFVGDYLLYGSGNGWGPQRDRKSPLYAVRWAGGDVAEMELAHGVDRIEAMGANALVVGAGERDLHFTGIRLADSGGGGGSRPSLAQRYTLANASQGETRSHGFFYKPDGPSTGTLGLPVRGAGRAGYEHLFRSSASILFLRDDGERFAELGKLASNDEGVADDACQASCVDWYGNARPLFLRNRVFALLGYELVEGRVEGGRIRELRRASFAPSRVRAVRR